MVKSRPVSKTLREYSEASTVHGISYVFSTSLPLLDRLLWTLLTFVSLALAAYWSLTAYNNWQANLVTTTLKDAAKPVTRLPFPAVTICTSGLDMEAVKDQLMEDFNDWKKNEKKETDVDREKDVDLLEEFMRLKFEISDTSAMNIFDILKALHSPDPKKTRSSLSVLQSAIACADEQYASQRNATTCPFPYTAIPAGDIPGYGFSFMTQTHYNPETCAGYCEASTKCCSFEIAAEGLSPICYLNEECNPRTNPVPSQLFCTKGKDNGIRK